MVRMQLRDSKGRWIEMGGLAHFDMPGVGGGMFKVFGRIAGIKDNSTAYVQVKGDPNGFPDGFYEVPGVDLETIPANLESDYLLDLGLDVPGLDYDDVNFPKMLEETGAVELDPKLDTSVVTGDSAMSRIREDAFNLAKEDGKFPLINGADDIDRAVGAQYRGLFEDFKTRNPEFADKFANADEYWDYIKGGGVSTTTRWVDQDKLNPILQESNKLYAEQVLGVPDGGYIELYRNAVNHNSTQELSAAGYASLDRDMAWDYASEKGLKNGIDGRYIIKVKPEEVQGVLGFSQARDEYAVVVGPDVTSIPGRITRVGDTEVIPAVPYIDDTKTFSRMGGNTPHRHFTVASQYDFKPLKEEFMKGDNWNEFAALQEVSGADLKAKMDELYGAGTFINGREALGGMPQFSLFKDMFVQLPGGEWGIDPHKIESFRNQFSGPDQNGKFDYMMKMLTAFQSVTGNWFMEPGTNF